MGTKEETRSPAIVNFVARVVGVRSGVRADLVAVDVMRPVRDQVAACLGAEQLAEAIGEEGIYRYEAAEQIGIDPSRLSRILEFGRLTLAEAIRIQKRFGVAVELWDIPTKQGAEKDGRKTKTT